MTPDPTFQWDNPPGHVRVAEMVPNLSDTNLTGEAMSTFAVLSTSNESPSRTAGGQGCVRWFEASPLYASMGLLLALAVVPLLAATMLDDRVFQGVNVWVKPLKFAVALAVYLLTLAWFARYADPRLTESPWWRWHARAVVIGVVAEMAWIAGAAALGTGSHFNVGTPAAATLYSLMGVAAVVLTSASTALAWAIHRNPHSGLSRTVKSGLVWGLALTLPLTLITAGTLSSMNGHWIGGTPSDAAGLPIMGWSRDGGDLRVAHFFATHAMHFIPLAAWAIFHGLRREALGLVRTVAVLFTGLVAYTFVQALMGRPFLPFLGA